MRALCACPLCMRRYGREVDIWSIGVCLYVMVAMDLPFKSNSLTELHALMLDGDLELPPVRAR